MRRITTFIAGVLLLVTSAAGPARSVAPDPKMTPEQIIGKIHASFMAQKIKTLTYDETRTVYYVSRGANEGVMPLNPDNGATYIARYFYQAPASHGYRTISNPIKNYWIGSPNQPGALPMDEKWKDKIFAWFDVYRPKDMEYRGRKCYLVALLPKKNTPKNLYPMTWYVDPEKFIVIKFYFLIGNKEKSVSTKGEMYYKKINGRLFPSSAVWNTQVSGLPYDFKQKSTFSNYRFNVPLDESVFKEEFPEDWFKDLGEKPPPGLNR